METSLGRILFNEALPETWEFVNEALAKKSLIDLVGEVIHVMSNEEATLCLDAIKNLGFEYVTQSGMTWGISDLVVPGEKKDISW